MLKADLHTLAQNLNALAETFERKPVTEKALEVWFDTLRDFPTERVMNMLINWPKQHARFPVPAEVWKAANELGLTEREDRAAGERADNRGQPEFTGATEHGRKMLVEIKGIIGRRRSPLQHWQRLLEMQPEGLISRRYAEEALATLKARGREPGEDEPEPA